MTISSVPFVYLNIKSDLLVGGQGDQLVHASELIIGIHYFDCLEARQFVE